MSGCPLPVRAHASTPDDISPRRPTCSFISPLLCYVRPATACTIVELPTQKIFGMTMEFYSMFFQRKADRSRSVVPLFLFFVRQFLPIVRCLSCGTFQFLSRMGTRRQRVVAVNVLVDERNADNRHYSNLVSLGLSYCGQAIEAHFPH